MQRTIHQANNYVAVTHEKANMFATLFLTIIDTHSGEMHYINCGQEPPLVLDAEGAFRHLAPTGPVVGIMPEGFRFPQKQDLWIPVELDRLYEDSATVRSLAAYGRLRGGAVTTTTPARNVKLPRSLVEDAIDSNPSSITLHARNEWYDAVLEKNRAHYGTGGTAIFVLDPDTGERRSSTVPSEDSIKTGI